MLEYLWFWLMKSLAEMLFGLVIFGIIVVLYALVLGVILLKDWLRRRKKAKLRKATPLNPPTEKEN